MACACRHGCTGLGACPSGRLGRPRHWLPRSVRLALARLGVNGRPRSRRHVTRTFAAAPPLPAERPRCRVGPSMPGVECAGAWAAPLIGSTPWLSTPFCRAARPECPLSALLPFTVAPLLSFSLPSFQRSSKRIERRGAFAAASRESVANCAAFHVCTARERRRQTHTRTRSARSEGAFVAKLLPRSSLGSFLIVRSASSLRFFPWVRAAHGLNASSANHWQIQQKRPTQSAISTQRSQGTRSR